MYRPVIRFFFAVILFVTCVFQVVALAQDGKRLVTINTVEYTDEDYINWWKHWNDKNQLKAPLAPDDFIIFQLMVQQGRDMGYDALPSYLHKLDVFLQVRALMALKYEEVDSKAIVTDADLRKYFDDNYATNWVLQILAFDSEPKAKNVYDAMLPFKGQAAGQLVFADWYGAGSDEKAETYDEVTVSASDFYRNKKSSWLPVVRKLEVGEVSPPFLNEDNKKFLLIRLVESHSAGEGVFEDKRQSMTESLAKEKRNQLTSSLIENLKKKYNVQVDRELFNSIMPDVDYPKEFLDRRVVSMSDFEATARDLIYNIKREKNIRKDVADDVIKELVLSSLISQTLVNKESLARGYEKRPPLVWTFDFYKQNRLRSEVEAGLMSRIDLSDQDIQNYYDLNTATFSIPEKLTFLLLKGEEGVLEKVWLGTLQGSDFNELAQKYSLEISSQSRGVVDLATVLVAEMKKLDKGGVSSPFMLDANYALVKLLDRVPGQVLPLEQVKGKIVEQLKKERFEIVKAEYVDKLKSKSKIDINERVWNGLVRELGNGKKD